MNNNLNKKPYIIGITGSRGKSSVAYLLSKALKAQGKNVVSYSSIAIDSPRSGYQKDEAVENPVYNQEMILEALSTEADYLILEVNERAIDKGLVSEIDFDLRCLTNIVLKQNEYYYQENKYLNLKLSFLQDNPNHFKNSIKVYSTDDKNIYDQIKALKLSNEVFFTTKYIASCKGIKEENVDVLLKAQADQTFASLNGLCFDVETKDEVYPVTTNLNMPYMALNITNVIAILKSINMFDYPSFQNLIENIIIPGRNEIIKYNNRTIIINLNLTPDLEILKDYQTKEQIGKIVCLTGATGLSFRSWIREYNDQSIIDTKEKGIEFAYNYIDKYASFCYITTSDSGRTSKEELLKYQASFLKKVPYKLILDRKEAIKEAIASLNENDVLLISGRGNRRVLCHSYDDIKFHQDKEEVLEILREMRKEQ